MSPFLWTRLLNNIFKLVCGVCALSETAKPLYSAPNLTMPNNSLWCLVFSIFLDETCKNNDINRVFNKIAFSSACYCCVTLFYLAVYPIHFMLELLTQFLSSNDEKSIDRKGIPPGPGHGEYPFYLCIFNYLKLELLAQFPFSNDEKSIDRKGIPPGTG